MAYAYPVKNAKLRYCNFSGAPDKFNKKGQIPNFCVIIPEEDVGYFRDDIGFNVKTRVTDNGTYHYLKINIGRYADIYLRDANGEMHKLSPLVEDGQIQILDNTKFDKVDLMITPRNWDMGDRHGCSAYLKELFASEIGHSELYQEWMNQDTTLDPDD